MTLVELLLGLAITALIGLGIMTVLFAVTRGTATQNDARGLVVKEKVVGGRVGAALRGSKMVLASGTDYVILWSADMRDPGPPSLSQLRRLERDSSGRLWSYAASFPADWTQDQIDAADTEYPFDSDFNAVTTALKTQMFGTQSAFPGALWGTAISAFSVTPNKANPQAATMMSYRVTILPGSGSTQSDVATGAAALRNGKTAPGAGGVGP
jgi:hypothetical protein